MINKGREIHIYSISTLAPDKCDYLTARKLIVIHLLIKRQKIFRRCTEEIRVGIIGEQSRVS